MCYSYPYIIYVVSLIICLIIELYKKQNNVAKSVRLYCVFSYLIFLGCRGFIGWDWMSYYPFFLSLPVIGDVNYWEKIVGFERGFVVFASLIKSICDNYFALQLVIVAFYLYAVDKLLMRYARIYSLGFLVFLVMGGFATQIDLLRNSISIALFLLSIQYIESRKTKQYMFLNSIGLLFHTSSIVFFPLYYILQRRYDRKLLMVLFLIGNIIFLLQIQYLKPILSFLVSPIGGDVKYLVDLYFADNENANFYGIAIGYLERLLTTSLFLIYYDRIIRSAKYNLIFLNLYVLYFISFFYFGEIRIVTLRFSNLFTCSYWILYPALFSVISLKNNKILFMFFVSFYSLFKMDGLSNLPIFKYNLFFFENLKERYEQRKETSQIIDV